MASYSKRYKIDPETGERMKDPKTGKDIVSAWRIQDIINGERKEFTGKTKKDAEAKRDKYINEIEKYGVVLEKSNITVGDWVNKHLYTFKIHDVSASTFELYTIMYNKHIKQSEFATQKLTSINQTMVQDFLNSFADKLSHSSIRKIYLILLGAFDKACQSNLIRVNPAKGVIVPNKNKTPKINDCLTLDEQKRYIKALEPEKYKLLMLTALFTGMRKSEIIALTWSNVDTDNKIIHVREIIQTVKVYSMDETFEVETIRKAPKTTAGVRDIPIPDFLNEQLKLVQPTGDLKDYADQLVFRTSNNTHISPRNVLNYHRRVCERAKIRPVVDGNTIKYEGITFHGLRHTYITRLIESGENLKRVQEIAGHSSPEITLAIYTHVTKETVRSSADKQEQLYKDLMK